MYKRSALFLLFFFVCVALLFPQGLTTKATKDDWEEINFEFNSSVLSDGYPSLLRLAELLQKHPDYRVRVEGHTDFVGSDAFNDRLAMARANTVREFLIKYGARPTQIEAVGRGKRSPEVDNRTAEGRFMNRRVMLTVTDGQGRQVSAGGIGEAIKAMETPAPKPDCCSDILKKLDDIMAMLRDLKSENENLKRQVAELKQPPPPPPPSAPPAPSKEELAKIANEAAAKAVEAGKTRKFALLGLNIGPDTNRNVTFTGRGRFFAPFSPESSHAVQAEGEYLYFRDRQEGQFDIGLVNRFKPVQLGLFSSFKHVNIREFQSGGALGQGAMTFDFVFGRGRIGMFGTKGFLNNAVVNRAVLSRNVIEESYLRIVDQIGGSTQVGLWGDSYIEGNLGALFRKAGDNRPGGTVRLVQPINPHWAFTVEAGLNETLVGKDNTGRVVFGIQLGNWVRPKQFAELKHPVPVDIPRLRYEVLKRRVRTGNDPPVADAGADQIGVQAGTITLDGSASYDPDGDPITFEWTQIFGPPVTLSSPKSARTTFEAAAGQNYSFRLTVRDDHAGVGTAKVTVSTLAAAPVKIVRFAANPASIRAGETTTLVWEILNADEATITPLLGRVDPKGGTSTVTLDETTTFRLTARNRTSEVSETLVVIVARNEPRILSFQATPTNIRPGEVSTLSWQTENADQVSISSIGNVRPNGTATVSPTQTTTYTLTATNRFGSVSATATVTVGATPVRIVRFAATPPEILLGEQSTLVWEVENATDISISGIGSVQAIGTTAVSPTDTTTYTMTAKNAQGQVTATAIVTVLKPVKILNFTANPPASAKPGDPVVLSWTTQNATEVVITGVGSVPVNGSVTVKPTVTTSYSLVAYGKRSQATAIVVVKVGGFNRPPIADAGPNQVVADPVARLDGSKSYDPDGDPLVFFWRILGSQKVEFSDPFSATPTVKLLSGEGAYNFELTVSDNKGASSKATTRVLKVDP